MKIGIPRELKVLEGRVGLIPEACKELILKGHEVFIETQAGVLSGYSDEDYRKIGVTVVLNAAELYQAARLIVKVKEPVAADVEYLREHHVLFCYLHLAANKDLADQLCGIGLTSVAFETVTDKAGRLPLLTPMSEIAGRLSIQIAANLLHQPQGGRGVLLGGLPLTTRGQVVVLGAGSAGGAATLLASAMGADVTVFDKNRDRLEAMHQHADNITALYAYDSKIHDALTRADVVIGAVLLPGAHAPRVVTKDMVKAMRPGTVIVDIAVDQGGCVETIKPTNYENPTYLMHDVIHFGVTNMPGAVPRTASQALSAVITPYVEKLSSAGWELNPGLADGVNTRAGSIVHPAVSEALK